MSSQDRDTVDQTVAPMIDAREATHSLLETAAATGHFQTLMAGVRAAHLEGLLDGPDLLTLFAPADDALQTRLPEGEALATLLRNHVRRGDVKEVDLRTVQTLEMAGGAQLPVTINDGFVSVGGARILESHACTNGTLHVVDRILST